jgi:hypothetical protein
MAFALGFVTGAALILRRESPESVQRTDQIRNDGAIRNHFSKYLPSRWLPDASSRWCWPSKPEFKRVTGDHSHGIHAFEIQCLWGFQEVVSPGGEHPRIDADMLQVVTDTRRESAMPPWFAWGVGFVLGWKLKPR